MSREAPTVRISGKQVLYLNNYLERVLKDHPAAGWYWQRLGSAINGTSIALRSLTSSQLDLLAQAFGLLSECGGRWKEPTQKAAKRKLAVIEAWRGRSAIDRLGDVVR